MILVLSLLGTNTRSIAAPASKMLPGSAPWLLSRLGWLLSMMSSRAEQELLGWSSWVKLGVLEQHSAAGVTPVVIVAQWAPAVLRVQNSMVSSGRSMTAASAVDSGAGGLLEQQICSAGQSVRGPRQPRGARTQWSRTPTRSRGTKFKVYVPTAITWQEAKQLIKFTVYE